MRGTFRRGIPFIPVSTSVSHLLAVENGVIEYPARNENVSRAILARVAPRAVRHVVRATPHEKCSCTTRPNAERLDLSRQIGSLSCRDLRRIRHGPIADCRSHDQASLGFIQLGEDASTGRPVVFCQGLYHSSGSLSCQRLSPDRSYEPRPPPVWMRHGT